MFNICVCTVDFVVFKHKTAYELRISDWSSDVCSSDLRASIGLGYRLDGFEGLGLAAGHDRQYAIDRAGLAARDRRVDELQALPAGQGVQLARHVGRGRGVVHEDRTESGRAHV